VRIQEYLALGSFLLATCLISCYLLHRNKIGARNHIFVSINYYVNLSKLARIAGTLFSIGAAEKIINANW
jgi:hypothetical protein